MLSWCWVKVLFLVGLNEVVTANSVDADRHDEASFVIWSDGERESFLRRTQATSCGHHVDFESKADGQPLSAGDFIDESVSFVGGLKIKANRAGSSGFADGMIFNSLNPTGRDLDLVKFPFLKNIFIISADGDSTDPDDAGNGGDILMNFTDPVVMNSMRFLDIEEVDGDVGLFDPYGAFIAGFKIPRMLNGGQKVLTFLRQFVIGSLKIRFRGSGAIDDIKFTAASCFPPQTPDTLLKLLADASPDGGRVLRSGNVTTPQYQAFEWLLQDMQGKGYSDGRKLQRYALAVFYFSTGGHDYDYDYNDFKPWLTPGHECGWTLTYVSTQMGSTNSLEYYRNGCDTENPRATQPVTRIIIPQHRNLQGTIPREIGMLTSLQTLFIGELLCDIPSCKIGLQGTLPTEIGLLKDIVSIQLAETLRGATYGTLPTEIFQLSNLEILELRGLGLTGTIPPGIVTNLTKLEWIGLEDNNFTGTVPPDVVSFYGCCQDKNPCQVEDCSILG